MSETPVRVAMWSGPRNISTAMMRAWSSRADTIVCDEPLYARYLARTGADHPARDEIIRTHETDTERIVARLLGPVPAGIRVFYQKHMAHHLLDGDDLGWIDRLTNALLIRDPREMILSFIKIVPDPRPADLGLPQQARLFERIGARRGTTPTVIDARDVLDDPRGTLSALCARLGVPFDEAMLSWEPGRRQTDGLWARHWYAGVERSTGFAPHQPREGEVPARLGGVLDECRDLYDRLARHRLRPEGAA